MSSTPRYTRQPHNLDIKAAMRQSGPRSVRAILAFLAVVALLVIGVGWWAVGRVSGGVASAEGLELGEGLDGRDGATDILLVGADSRTDAQGNPLSEEELSALRAGVDEGEHNTDTIMVIRVPNDGSGATAVSIPRDTYIADPEMGNMKINGVFTAHKQQRIGELEEQGVTDPHEIEVESNAAGRDALVRVVSGLTGIEVDHYAEVGLLGFVLLTDAVGGVDVCLKEDTQDEYSGVDLEAGEHRLDGIQALGFVRQRHGLPRGDLDRVVRQQAYMASMVDRLLSAGTLANPAALSEIGQAVERSVVIDEDWDIIGFAQQMSDLVAGNVKFATIPVVAADGVGDYGESVVVVGTDEVHAFMEDLLGDLERGGAGGDDDKKPEDEDGGDESPDEPNPAMDKKLYILNAGTVEGLAGGVASHLDEHGYQIVEISNAQEGLYQQSQIVAADPEDPAAQALAEELGGIPVVADDSLEGDSLVVVIADEYDGPSGDPADAPAGTGEAESPEGAGPVIEAGDGPPCVY